MFTFKKNEHLKSKKTIERLFKDGNVIYEYPVRAIWIKMQLPGNKTLARVSFSVSKKRFKKAVDRNRIKRLMREAYRLNKQQFILNLENKSVQTAIMFVYIGDNLTSFKFIENKIIVILNRIESFN